MTFRLIPQAPGCTLGCTGLIVHGKRKIQQSVGGSQIWGRLSESVESSPWLNSQVNLCRVKGETEWDFILFLAFDRGSASSWVPYFPSASAHRTPQWAVQACQKSYKVGSLSHKTGSLEGKKENGGRKGLEDHAVLRKMRLLSSAPTQHGVLGCLFCYVL